MSNEPITMSECVNKEHYWRLRCAQALQQLEEANATIKALGDNLNDANKERAEIRAKILSIGSGMWDEP